jgi:hypothetical protein
MRINAMKAAKVKRLQAAGWKVGNAEDFLETTNVLPPEPSTRRVIAVDREGWYDGYLAVKDFDAWDKQTTTDEEWDW